MNESIPPEVLILRALSHFDLARLQLQAEKLDSATASIEKGCELLRKVL